jgi:hypothetical protein
MQYKLSKLAGCEYVKLGWGGGMIGKLLLAFWSDMNEWRRHGSGETRSKKMK